MLLMVYGCLFSVKIISVFLINNMIVVSCGVCFLEKVLIIEGRENFKRINFVIKKRFVFILIFN